jgi:hypothetical protein
MMGYFADREGNRVQFAQHFNTAGMDPVMQFSLVVAVPHAEFVIGIEILVLAAVGCCGQESIAGASGVCLHKRAGWRIDRT